MDMGVSPHWRAALADGLSQVLADSYTLYLRTHNFHWNVTGPMFHALHLMFETQYNELALAVDTLAERIRALDHPAPGSYAAFAELTSLAVDPPCGSAEEMVATLVADHEATARTARRILGVANDAKDAVTADVLTQRLDAHEKTAWMLRSLLA